MRILVVIWLVVMMVFTHPSKVFASATYGDKEDVTVVSVHDGDTFTVLIPDWPGVVSKIPVRVYGIDTPELRGKCPLESQKASLARTFTKLFLVGNKVTLKNIRRDKYFRLLADAYVGTKSLSDELIAIGLAVPYFGGKQNAWCVV
jgi:endonuclease YncB( thermonuclease family)